MQFHSVSPQAETPAPKLALTNASLHQAMERRGYTPAYRVLADHGYTRSSVAVQNNLATVHTWRKL